MKVIHAKRPIKLWVGDLDGVEESALTQLKNVASLPFIHKWVSVMPDVHLGKGASIGSVVASKGAVVPALVGVDIGCGMMAAKLDLKASDLPDNLGGLRSMIESVVPVGNVNGSFKKDMGVRLDFRELTVADELKHSSLVRATRQLGTLGGGNHFIELCLDENQDVWVMLHSGSRHIGAAVANRHIDKAKQWMKNMFITLPDPDLAYFASSQPEYQAYLNDVMWCQEYARNNRTKMFYNIMTQIDKYFDKPVNLVGNVTSCHHNYISIENHYGENVVVTRKGAVQAREGQLGIIPGSMGTKSYIVRGKGNKESFCSCSHGAGRAMSRTAARKKFTLDDFNKQTAGVECRKEEELIDEIPAAYKDIDTVMENQKELVDIVHTLKQVMCIKG